MTNRKGVQTTNTTKTVQQLLDYVDKNQLVLPEIQREFVWKKKAVNRLFDSLFRGLPIGNLLIWNTRTQQGVNPRALKGQKALARGKGQPAYGYLLDGQQRLTAIRLVRDADDSFPLMFYAWPDREKDGDQPFYWRSSNEDDYAWTIPVAEILSPDFKVADVIANIKTDEEFQPHHEELVREDLSHIRSVLDYSIGVVEFETDDAALATELFIRFNSTGTKLRSSDLTLAELAQRVPGLTNERIRRAQAKWPRFHFTLPFLAQCLIAVHTGRLQLRDPKQVWTGAIETDVKASWDRTERAFDRLVEFLTSTVRWSDSTLIPSFNALIPLICVLAAGGDWSGDERRLARRWLLLASVRRYFSGSSQTDMDKLLKTIGPKPTVDSLWKATSKRLRRLRPEDFETGRISGPIMSLFLSHLRDCDARDWKHEDFKLDGTVAGHGAALQIHHFFPRALLRKRKELAADEINTFANYTVISAKTNLDVSSEEPASYVDRLGIPTEQLDNQCIPTKPELLKGSEYREFLKERRRLLAERLNAFLGV